MTSIDSRIPAKAMKLKHTIKLIQELTAEIDQIKFEIKATIDKIPFPIFSILGISYRVGAMILGKIGFIRFASPDKILF